VNLQSSADAQHNKRPFVMADHPIIGHTSVYADDPQSAATKLAGMIGGHAAPFRHMLAAWSAFCR